MKFFISVLSFGLASGAALIPRDAGCCFQINVGGGPGTGPLWQLSDGQNRVGAGSYSSATYCLNNGIITDSSGRGCILTPPTTQFQCDQGATGNSTFSVACGGAIAFNGNTQFYECLVSPGVWNIYTSPGGTNCSAITLSTANGACGVCTSSVPVSPISPTPTPTPIQTSVVTVVTTATVTGPGTITTATVTGACSPTTATVAGPTVTQSVTIPAYQTITVTAPGTTLTSTVAGPTVTATATATITGPGTTQTVTGPTVTAIATATAYGPGSTVTVAGPTVTNTAVQTVSVTGPGATVVSTVAGPTVVQTTTVAGPANTVYVTSTAPGGTVTSLVTAPCYPGTVTITSVQITTVQGPGSTVTVTAPGSGPSTITSVVTSVITQTVTSPSSPTAKTCATNIPDTNFQYPHLIVPVSSTSPNTAYGSSYFGTVNSTTSTIFNFDIPSSYQGTTCTLVFLLPAANTLQTSSYTLTGSGSIDVLQLSAPASASTTYNNQPSVAKDLGTFAVTSGSSSIIATGACAAGQTVAYELKATGSLALNYFQDYNAPAIGLYITEC